MCSLVINLIMQRLNEQAGHSVRCLYSNEEVSRKNMLMLRVSKAPTLACAITHASVNIAQPNLSIKSAFEAPAFCRSSRSDEKWLIRLK